jgi:hypothetical protein
MAVIYKILGQSSPADTNANTLYTVPAGNSAVISTLNICNLGYGATFRVAVQPRGLPLGNANYIAYNTFIPANDSIALTLGMTLAATDVVSVQSNTALTVSFTLFGSEIY